MKNKLIFIFISALLVLGITSCGKDDIVHDKELTLTIASEKAMNTGGIIYSPYFAKEEGASTWRSFEAISNFEYEEGYEYKIKVWREKWHNGEVQDGSIYRYKLLNVISKEKKDSEKIPAQRFQITIASKRNPDTATSQITPYYAVFSNIDWTLFPAIEGLDYEEGYEYVLLIDRIFKGSNAPSKFTFKYIETYSKTKKDSGNLP